MTIKQFKEWMLTSTAGQQIKNALDEATKEKILKGFIWAFIDGGIIAGFTFLGVVDVSDPALLSILSSISIGGLNAWSEYKKGN